MNGVLREGINKIAETILDSFEIEAPVINLESIVEKLGGTIQEDLVLCGYDARIEKVNTGLINFRITLPKFEDENRRRFSIAHELGHLFLHMGYLIDEELWESNSNEVFFRKEKGEMEYQANEFAAAFLMPREDFSEVMKENYKEGYYNMKAVAEAFQVSISAAINRGRWLGYLSWE